MAKILVADDNSNVQKTLALALANLGVEIAAVNNGEAAVRKLPDISPDLILADIFMPVRNGYEVCEYAKKDSRFSHIPVILLVGAFDPFDEREAQRVGADGILKKPFVPPEPLITMVKTLLDRASRERVVAVSASKPAIAANGNASSVAVAEVHTPVQEPAEESPAELLVRPVEHVEFGEGDRPVAFGDLLETPAQDSASSLTEAVEPVDDEQILTSSRPATLGDPIFWRNESPEPEVEPEAPLDTPVASELRTWKKEEDCLPGREDTAFLQQPVEPIDLVREEQDETSPSVVDSEPILLDAAAQAALTVDSHKPDDLAANPLEWMATAPSEDPTEALEPPPGRTDPVPDEAETLDIVESSVHPVGMAPVSSEASAKVSSSLSVPVLDKQDAIIPEESSAPPVPEPAIPALTAPAQVPAAVPNEEIAPTVSSQSTIETARSIPLRDWQDLTAALGLSEKIPLTQENKFGAEPAPQPPAIAIASPPPAPSAQLPEVVRESLQPVLSALAQLPEAATSSLEPAPATPAKPVPADPVLVDAVVERVLDKMRPQVVDIITKELLRPIVQALVQREIDKQ